MWNFSIPYVLKFYIDAIVQSSYMYRYNELGQPIPLVHGKKMICISTRGGDYSLSSPMHTLDFQEPYLRSIFGFIGITDLRFINAQSMDVTPALREVAIASAIEEAKQIAQNFGWEMDTAPKLSTVQVCSINLFAD